MKRCLTIVLIGIIFFSSTEVMQFVRLPFLFFHYSEHHGENDKLTFLSYVKEHYARHPSDQDEQKDSQLPFKTVSGTTCSIVLFLLQIPVMPVRYVVQSGREKYPCSNEAYPKQMQVNDVFHPPKS